MKICPRCKKSVDSNDKKCPHCGYSLTGGYQPIKRGRPQQRGSIILFALLLIVSPLITTFLFSSTSQNNSVYMPNKPITLGKLGNADINSEKSVYLFDSLDKFNEKVTNVDEYVNGIKIFEDNLSKLISGYDSNKIDKSYQIYITDQENVYYYLTYRIKFSNQSMIIDLQYDLSKKTNNANIEYYVNGFNDFESMRINDQSYPMFKSVVKLINGSNSELFIQTGEEFNKLEDIFKENNEYLGNYGIGISKENNKDKCGIRVLADDDKYTVRINYKTIIDLKRIVKDK